MAEASTGQGHRDGGTHNVMIYFLSVQNSLGLGVGT